jgi:hypothetical protein
MKKAIDLLATLVVAVGVALGGSAVAQEKQKTPQQEKQQEKKADASAVAGKWRLALETPHGVMTMAIELKVEGKDGKKVAGTLTIENQNSVKLAGEFADGKLRFKTTSAPEFSFLGTMKDADTMPGILSSEHGDLSGTATRVK